MAPRSGTTTTAPAIVPRRSALSAGVNGRRVRVAMDTCSSPSGHRGWQKLAVAGLDRVYPGPRLCPPVAVGTLFVALLRRVAVDFRPGPGQVALVEYPGEHEPRTGLVTNGHQEHIAIDLGAQAPQGVPDAPIVVSVYAPDALYRLR